ncbi:S1/P1 nuclease [Mucilaginibacter jinjuensis]|uniref:S1/P1 nuclease n=1 Tax=Mucilaginibacter jinjuensis TaxID=1176721 RepID=A0ABY7T1T1_9SPHI|nr:S1/P1 nuclease [Mucilaginibacter jinjuensis]WCT10218.1 S1/P1 nuclease [Mucilaginibacter jinjuensis]
MKKYFVLALMAVCSLSLVSWGVTGHRAVAQIAENHLTPNARLAVKKLLGNESLADVSTYADELRSNPQYKYTAPWHFVNLPSGYTFDQFANAITNSPGDNGYKALLNFEHELGDPTKSRTQKALALKFIVHIVGDLHQPMHVSHAEDKGGNNIQIIHSGYNESLHSLWDEGIIDHQGFSYKKMATEYDNATPVEIEKWQKDPVMIWLWESYQISSILYEEAAQDNNFTEEYYQQHLPILEKRIEKGGIRLAGVINSILDKQ